LACPCWASRSPSPGRRPGSRRPRPPAARRRRSSRWNPVGTGARAQEIDGEFVVLKGSTARKQGIPSWTSYKALRDQLVQEGKLADGPNPSLYAFTEDVPFNSPSAAAAVVFGGNQRGPVVWRTEDGSRTYRDWQEEKLKQAGVKLPGS
jgi:hypothetical protein